MLYSINIYTNSFCFTFIDFLLFHLQISNPSSSKTNGGWVVSSEKEKSKFIMVSLRETIFNSFDVEKL